MAVLGVCLMVAGIVVAVVIHGNGTSVAVTTLIGLGVIMFSLGLRAVLKGRKMMQDLSSSNPSGDARS